MIGALVGLGNMHIFGADVGFRDRTGPAPPDDVLEGRVDYVLKGSVSRDGSHVEVNIELLRATDGQYLWSSRFNWELGAGNMVDLRHDIARQIAHILTQSHVGKTILLAEAIGDSMASCVAPGTNLIGAMMIVTAIRCYKFGQGKPSHDYWWRFETEPFKLGRAISSLFCSISHKEGLPIMGL